MATPIEKVYSIRLAVQGENATTPIEIDMTTWAEEFPNASFYILFKPYNTTDVVPVITEYVDHILRWVPTIVNTAIAGIGYTEVRAIDSDTGLIKKSRIIPTSVENSVSGYDGIEPPSSAADWVNSVLESKNAAENAANTAIAQTGIIDQVILIQDEEPTAEHNKLYIKKTPSEAVEVATEEELTALRTEVQGDLAEIQEDVHGVKTDVAALQTDVQGVESDVATLQTDVQGLNEDIFEVQQQASDGVKFTSQNLTDAQKTQARENIGAADQGEVTELKSAIYKNPSARAVSDNVAPVSVQSINLLNPNDPDFEAGKFINGKTGAIDDNASYNTTGYIHVSEGQKIAFTVYIDPPRPSTAARRQMRTIAAYDSSKNLVASAGVNTNTDVYTVPQGVSFIRFSSIVRSWSDFSYYMVWDCRSDSVSYTIVDYQPYGNVYTDGVLQIPSYPRFIKYGVKISFTAKFDTFESSDHVYIGWMDDSSIYQGYWEITSTSVIFHVGANTVLTTLAHGLTLSEYISCVITVHSDVPNFSIVINTKDGTYNAEQSGETTRTLLCGVPTFATNTPLTDVVMSVSNSQTKNKVWVFGDSYMGYGSDRILGNLFSWGFTENVLVDALGGMNSTGAYQELNRLLEYGKPTVIIWMLGMNDNSEDLPIYSTLAAFCDDNDITLILNKCPVVPSRISENTAQNSAVIATGKRYVDSYLAVGCDGTGTWYSGMLSTDNVHPTSTGAAAIASRMLIDAPEIAPN